MAIHEKAIHIKYQELDSVEDLSEEEKEYLEQAMKIREEAYAVYSNFSVGSVVVFEDGTIVTGNNQENISYPEGLCAERVALNYAKANFKDKKITHVVVVGGDIEKGSSEPITPCGGCCGVISETERRNDGEITFILASTRGKILKLVGSKSLLPFAFNDDNLTNNNH